ncbi:hypothetical protein [Kytococcus sp. Marseille-QA3725]
MANALSVDGTILTFPAAWDLLAFDDTPEYSDARGFGIKGCDVVAIDGDDLWLIEVKDYTYPGARPPQDLPDEIVRKVIGTMGLLALWSRAPEVSDRMGFGRRAMACSSIRIALHVEFPDKGRGRALLMKPLSDQKDRLVTKARKPLRVHKHDVVVTSSLAPAPGAPWTGRRDPDTRERHLPT